MGVVPRETNKQAWKDYLYGGRSTRAVEDYWMPPLERKYTSKHGIADGGGWAVRLNEMIMESHSPNRMYFAK